MEKMSKKSTIHYRLSKLPKIPQKSHVPGGVLTSCHPYMARCCHLSTGSGCNGCHFSRKHLSEAIGCQLKFYDSDLIGTYWSQYVHFSQGFSVCWSVVKAMNHPLSITNCTDYKLSSGDIPDGEREMLETKLTLSGRNFYSKLLLPGTFPATFFP